MPTTLDQDAAFVRGSTYRHGALTRIAATSGLNPADIARHLRVQRSNMSTAINQLARRGLVELTSPGERRHEYKITARGKSVLDRLQAGDS